MMFADAVMPTSPASAEFMIATTSGRPMRNHESAIPVRPPKAAASVVLRITEGTSDVSP